MDFPASGTPVLVDNPSNLTCFTCHRPHTRANFDLNIANGTDVALLSGTVYKKKGGNICAACHQMRGLNVTNTAAKTIKVWAVNDLIVNNVKTGGSGDNPPASATAAVSVPGSHNGGPANMLMGKDGAQFSGKTYSTGAHTTQDAANCITCHKTYPQARFGGSPALAGHSFRAVGDVHGALMANTAGCLSCHSTIKTAITGASGALPAKGHMLKGDPYYYLKSITGTDEFFPRMSNALALLADPSNGCDGLFQKAYETAAIGGKGKIVDKQISTNVAVSSQFIPDNRCNAGIIFSRDDSATIDSPKVKFAQALFNYRWVLADNSFGVHNPTYSLQLLYDSCDALKSIAKSDVNCGTRP